MANIKNAEENILRALECLQNGKEYKVGTKAKFSGVYRLGNQYIPLSKNETFPPAKNQDGLFWLLVIKL